MQDRIFYGVCFGFVFGVLLRSFIKFDLYFLLLVSVITVALFLFFALRSLGEVGLLSISRNKWGIITTVFIFAFLLGIFRFNSADTKAPEIFEQNVGQKVNLSGIIIDEPDIRETSQKLLVEVSIDSGSSRSDLSRRFAPPQGPTFSRQKSFSTKILLSANLTDEYKYGEEINFEGKLEKPENFLTDQDKVFDYVNYLRKDGILYLMNYPKIEIVGDGEGNKIKSALFYVKNKFLEKLNLAISASTESLLMGGLILGEKSEFDQALRQSFVNTGTIHIVALSGYNVTIVAEWIMKLFSFLPLTFGIGIGILAILFFILMTGASSTMLVFQKHIAGKTKASICCISCKI